MFNFQDQFFLFAIVLLLFNSCNDTPSSSKQKYSKTQLCLFQLANDYKSEYLLAKNEDDKDSIQNKYLLKFKTFLDDSLNRRIDSILVTVDTIIDNNWLLTTQFHSLEIEFKYSMKFNNKMDSANSTLYKKIKKLNSKNEILLNFIKLGGFELNSPYDTNNAIVRIFAFPFPN